MQEIWQGHNYYISPWSLKKIIGKVSNQFSGYQQQDSQEFLLCLLDNLHEDLNRIRKKPSVKPIDYENQPDDELSKLSWDNFLKRDNSVITDLLAGQFKSTLHCPCKRVSLTFDPFMILSVPVPQN